MSLRTRILLFLFLFGLVPLLLAVLINLPLVLERVDLFYRHALLQNLRADFSDLDQHLASRDASVRLLARLPEPGALVGDSQDQAEIDLARARYTQWINRILGEERDITEILFLDESGVARFWLEREGRSGEWRPTVRPPRGVAPEQVAMFLSGRITGVVLSPLRVDLNAQDPARVFTLQLLSPIQPAVDGEPPIGLVAITLDIAGLVRRDSKTLWVHDDGSYLRLPDRPARDGNAFTDFPGLEDRFRANRIALWEQGEQRAIWVPMFRTDDGGTLWVGRPVDVEPLRVFRSEIVFRVLLIVLVLVVLQFIVARWITRRAERIGRDLTEGVQKTLESDQPVRFQWSGSRELRQLAADLTRLSRTHASQTRNLRAHARELEATNRYKSQFLANVSHELRTPLNSILLLSKLLASKDVQLDDESRRQADVIHKAGRDLKALIENILDLSRIEAGRMELHVGELVVGELFDDLQLLMQPQFDAKGLAFDTVIDPSAPPVVMSDNDKVRQVLKNFLANAVKFTSRGSVTLLATPASGRYALTLAVRDTGVGIARGQQASIFEAFQQADGSTSRRYGGTGLGLTISRELAELLGGRIRLVSAPGEGAEFALDLPAECRPADGQGAAAPYSRLPQPVAEEPVAPAALQGRHALLMAPDVRLQLRIGAILRDWGVRLHLADDLEEVRETLDELSDVGFVLIGLPVSGANACATIGEIKRHLGDAIVISLTRDDASAATHDGECSAIDASVAADCDAGELAEVLTQHLPATTDPAL